MNAEGADARMGMTWWNRLTAGERVEWMRRAGNTGVAADARAAFKSNPVPRTKESPHVQVICD